MNILVKTYDNKYIVRPDTTWERDNEDFYPPEFVSGFLYTPVLFARICKPGRSIGRKFASRYYDGVSYGVLLYPQDLLDGSETGFACASCLDHSSFLPFPIFNPSTLGIEENAFKLYKDDKELFSYNEGTIDMIEEAIEEASKYIYMRSGDIIAIELAPKENLFSKSESERCRIKATFCSNELMQFDIIM